MCGAYKGGLMSNSGLSLVAPIGEMVPLTDNIRFLTISSSAHGFFLFSRRRHRL